jgi:PAS domain S-box-containing protein
MTKRSTGNRHLIERLNTAGAVLLLVVCLGAIIALAQDVQNRLDALARANSDSMQWALAQLEVEATTLGDVLTAPEPDLAEVRKRFDIFYSRTIIFETSALYAGLREGADFAADLGAIQQFLQRAAPLLDGPDDALRAALPSLAAEASDLHRLARSLSLAGIEFFSAESDRRRTEMAMTLRRLAGLTALLIGALSVLVFVLLRLYRGGKSQAAENRMTTARLETIVATSVDAIVVVDRRGIVIEFNPAAETTFGYSRAEAIGGRVAELIIPPESVGDTITTIETQLISPEARRSGRERIELEALRKNGTRFPVEVSVAKAESSNGEIFAAFIRDISERRQADRDLTAARDQALKGERAKAEFLAVMSHEMRTPLNGLLGSVDILGATALTGAQREILEVIETSGQVLLHHVNSVLDISSAEATAMRSAETPFVIEALVREVVANQTGLAAAAGNRIEIVSVTDPAGRVRGDPARLRQILLNLVGNAVKFTRSGRITVEIEVEQTNADTRMVEFRVIDSGIGIPEADHERIFEDFVTLDSSYGREAGGTGLGLGITRRLVRALGGEIGIESEPGEGSLFWVRLPFALEAATGPAGDDLPDPGPAGGVEQKSVLIIEDNAINRFVLRTLLEEVNHRVSEAIDGLEGVAMAEAEAYDILLMDISMPRLDGIEAARRIRGGDGRSSKARIIAVTAHALPDEIDRFRDAGIDDYLIKPVTRGILGQALSGAPRPVQAMPLADRAQALPILDLRQLDELFARLDDSTADELLRRFIAEGDEAIPQLTACPPVSTLDRLCHRLAGSAATFGAARLAAVLTQTAERERTESALSELQRDLDAIWQATRPALETARRSQDRKAAG